MLKLRYDQPKLPFPNLAAETTATGRTYVTPDGPAPSVTTILGSIPNPALQEWRDRVGEEEALRITEEATTIGSYMHDRLEAELRGQPFPKGNSDLYTMAMQMYQQVAQFGFRNIQDIIGVEVCLHLSNLYAGRTDLIAIENNSLAIVDYKTSKFRRDDDMVEKYRIQTALYAIALEDMFGEKADHSVLLIALRPNWERKIPSKFQMVRTEGLQFQQYRDKAMRVLEWYYGDRKGDPIHD